MLSESLIRQLADEGLSLRFLPCKLAPSLKWSASWRIIF